jgi:trimethylamine:corrinoid methyltransferase-like protein
MGKEKHMLTGTVPSGGRTASMLTQPDLETIHSATLRVLQEVGVEFQHQGALEAINQSPEEFVLHARNPAYDLALGQGGVYCTSAFGATFVCDSERERYRKTTLDDLVQQQVRRSVRAQVRGGRASLSGQVGDAGLRRLRRVAL